MFAFAQNIFEWNEPEVPSSNQLRNPEFNAAHAQLLKKLRPIAFAETCRFLTIQSLEVQEIWPKISLETTWMIYHEKSEFWYREFLILEKTI